MFVLEICDFLVNLMNKILKRIVLFDFDNEFANRSFKSLLEDLP